MFSLWHSSPRDASRDGRRTFVSDARDAPPLGYNSDRTCLSTVDETDGNPLVNESEKTRQFLVETNFPSPICVCEVTIENSRFQIGYRGIRSTVIGFFSGISANARVHPSEMDM